MTDNRIPEWKIETEDEGRENPYAPHALDTGPYRICYYDKIRHKHVVGSISNDYHDSIIEAITRAKWTGQTCYVLDRDDNRIYSVTL